MARIAQDAADEQRMPAAGELQSDVVVELKREQIDVGELAGQRRLPAAEVRRVTNRPAASLEAKTVRHRSIVWQRDRHTPAVRVQLQRLPGFIVADQARRRQRRKGPALVIELVGMVRMAIDRQSK